MSQPNPVGDAPAVDADGVRDFTIRREPIRFRIDDDVFQVPNTLAIPKLRKLAGLHAELGDTALLMSTDEGIDRMLDATGRMFELIIGGADGRKFVERLNSNGDIEDPAPIDLMKQAMPVLFFVLESYGLRPTEPSSASLPGSTDGQTATPSDGISSTDGASPEESAT